MTQRATYTHLNQPLKVTAIGGGHGLGRVLAALSFLGRDLAGIVTTTDNGGASGRLRKSHQGIAWGDIRNCLAQLAQQPLAAEVLNYRFPGSDELAGHNLGNLLLHSLDDLSARPTEGIALLSRLLQVSSPVFPMTETAADLVAQHHETRHPCFGEVDIDRLPEMPGHITISPTVQGTPEALRRLRRSDVIILGPGSFLTSILPPLLVADMQATIRQSRAPIIFIDNLIPDTSPAGQLSLKDRLAWLQAQTQLPAPTAIISARPEPGLSQPVFDGVAAVAGAAHRHCPEHLAAAIDRTVGWLRKQQLIRA